MIGPLHGVRVLELGGIGPGPFCAAVLADLGADVIRLERPGHQPHLPPHLDPYNRNKRSVLLDMKAAGGAEAALKMVAAADVLIEGFRPGVAERLGLGPETCRAVNPRLVYGRVTGWGQEGPLAQVAGHDINYIAMTGALHAVGSADQPPVPPLNLVGDLGGGAMFLAVGVVSALLEARQTGRGRVVDMAMVDGVLNMMSMFFAFRHLGQWSERRGDNSLDGGSPFYATYRTRDGKYVAVGAFEPHFYRELLAVLGLAGENLPAQHDRAGWPLLRQRFAAIFAARTRDEWVKAFDGRDACFAPVLSMGEVPDQPHLRARGSLQQVQGMLHPTPAPRFDGVALPIRRPPPVVGQHDAEALLDWGFSATDIDALRATGALRPDEAGAKDARAGSATTI
jgi:alpha-methylacyl-CoA racemase